MTTVQIRNVPDDVARQLKAQAAAQRRSLSDYLLARLSEIATEPTPDELLKRLAGRPRRDLGVSGADLVAESRADDRP